MLNKYNQQILQLKDKIIKEYCEYYKIPVDYNIKSSFNKVNDNNTIALYLAQRGIIPPDYFYHQPQIQNKYGQTVAMLLQINNIKIPHIWYHNPKIQIESGYTVALLQASQGQIPEKQWEHDKHLRCKHVRKLYDEETQFYDIYDQCLYTVQNFLQEFNIQVPEQWKYQVEDTNDNTKEMILAQKGIISENINNIIPYQTNIHGDTIAMMFVQQQIIPPKSCVYKQNIKNVQNKNIQFYFNQNKMPMPNEWIKNKKQQQNTQIFQDALYGILPTQLSNSQWNPQDYNPQGFTIAMIIAKLMKQEPQKQYIHSPNIQNIYGDTVASILYQNKISFSNVWVHDPNITLNDKNETFAMLQAKNKEIPQECWYHDSTLRNKNNQTVAMILASNGIIPPKRWEHDPTLQDKNGNTVAMLLACSGINAQEPWYHDPLLLNEQSNTVAIILSSKGVVPQKHWMHNIDIQYGRLLSMQSIQENLRRHGYIYYKNEFIKLQVQIEKKNDTCVVCLQDGEQYFIKTVCKHNICCQCFKQLIEQEQDRYCPICKQENWMKIVNKQDDFSCEYEKQYNQEIFDIYTNQHQY